MSKNFAQSAEDRSIFLVHSTEESAPIRNGDRADTSPYRSARMVDIKRIQPDPDQPRKTFIQETLESLAESIQELEGVIDPLAVEYVQEDDFFRIISGERRYRAAKLAGLEKLPCIIQEVDDRKRFLLQFISNIQREDITPLEEAAGIRHLVDHYGYTQIKIAKLFNKSKSYVSQILGLERLTNEARAKAQTSELAKEVQIQASREKDPLKQLDILEKASEERKTVRQIRKKGKNNEKTETKEIIKPKNNKSQEWFWTSADGRFKLALHFNQNLPGKNKMEMVREALQETLTYVHDSTKKGGTLS